MPEARANSTADQKILRAASLVAIVGLLVKAIATLKEFVVAGVYGRSDAMDAFLIAFLLPNLLVNLIAESMNQALVPTLIRVRELEGRIAAQRLFSNSLVVIVALLGGATLLFAALAHFAFPLLAPHFSPEKITLTEHLFYVLLPMILLTGLATNSTAVLNTEERFAWPALAPAILPALIILAALTWGNSQGIWAVAGATTAGALAHCLLMAWMLNRHGYKLNFAWSLNSAAAREVATQYGPVFLSALVASGGLLVDQSMAAWLPSGSVSALVYAGRFVSVILTLLAGAISTAIVPYLSQQIAHRDWAACRTTLRLWTLRTAAVSIPIALILIAIARPLVRIAFQHGAFKAADTAIVAPVMMMSAIQIPFYVISRVHYRFIVAMRRTDLVFYCGLINLILDVILNLVLMRPMGVAGIALATSLWMVSTFVLLFIWSGILLRRAEQNQAAEPNSTSEANK